MLTRQWHDEFTIFSRGSNTSINLLLNFSDLMEGNQDTNHNHHHPQCHNTPKYVFEETLRPLTRREAHRREPFPKTKASQNPDTS